ncbi:MULTISPECIES: hypothetical protein [Moorena]|nr:MULTISPECIES: hypothetical protein [Moorena]
MDISQLGSQLVSELVTRQSNEEDDVCDRILLTISQLRQNRWI